MNNDTDTLQLLADCEHREERLKPFEHDFVVSLRDQVDAGRTLSLKQIGKLNEVWDRVSEFPARG